MTDATDELERRLQQQLDNLAQDYRNAAAPIIAQMAQLQAMRPLIHIIDGETYLPITQPKSCALCKGLGYTPRRTNRGGGGVAICIDCNGTGQAR
jgi:hypothetical protein